MSYQPEDPIEFLNTMGWPFKRRNGQLILTCPLCEKPEKLSMHPEKGTWHCWSAECGEKGNIYQLRQRLGLGRGDGIQSLGQALKVPPKRIPMAQVEALHAALLADQAALAYCTKTRGWSLEVVKRFKLGLRVDDRGKWIAYPWFRRGECIGMKFRISPANQKAYPKRFDREPGCQSILFNRDALDQYDEIILTSGEADALALLSLGFENVVATTTGEGALPAADVEALAKKSKVMVPFDNDPAGQHGVKEVGKRIGFERTFLVSLPDGIKDVNDFLIAGGTRAEFEALLKAAAQFDIPSVLSLSQALDRLEEQQAISALDETTEVTPWPTINKILGAWKPGDLNVLSGIQKAGKTTLALNVAAFWAARGLPALLYCLEMPVERVVAHTLCAHYQVGLDEDDKLPPGIIEKARVDLADWPLYLGGNPRITGHKAVTDLIRQAVRRFGLKLVIFDNLHMLARNLDHINEEIGIITKEFKNLAMELEIPIVLIAQPRKLQENRIMSPWDLKGSVDIYSDADSIVMLHREQLGSTESRDAVAAAIEAEDGIHGDEQDNWSPVTTVRVVSRYRPSRDRLLYFEGAEKRFRQLTEVERELAKKGNLK